MSKLWNEAPTPIFGFNGMPAAGALVYFFVSGTTTPLVVYQDSALTTPWGAGIPGAPVVANAAGYFPPIFLPYGDYGLRVTNAFGVALFAADGISNPAPVDRSGSGVDPDLLKKTGDWQWRLQLGNEPGWVRANGLTIGGPTSGATERANLDTLNLFTYFRNELSDAVCPVSGGRGASAAADFAANKTIGTPDMRGLSPFGLDDMGNALSNRLDGTVFAVGTRQLPGSRFGVNRVTLITGEMPPHDHGGSTGSAGSITRVTSVVPGSTSGSSSGPNFDAITSLDVTFTASANHTHTIPSQGGGQSHENMPPGIVGTHYFKL